MGAVILLFIGLYLILLVWATRRGRRWAVDRGWQGRKRWLGAAYGFLIVYLPVFWDWIPTIVTHQYYCATEAGFWVYKTPEQWKQQNPGGLEAIRKENQEWAIKYLEQWKIEHPGSSTEVIKDMLKKNEVSRDDSNQRFKLVSTYNQGPFFLHRWRNEFALLDTKTNEVMIRYIDFSTSQERRQAGFSGWKFWLDSGFFGNRNCSDGDRNRSLFWQFVRNFRGKKNEYN